MNLLDRLNKITTVDDMEEQIRLAKRYMMRLRTAAKAKPTLDEKITVQRRAEDAEATLRQLRRKSFDIEDAINAGTYQPEHFA